MKDIELWLGDCLEEMKKIPDNSVDLVFADLPYGVTANKKDVIIPFEPLWKEYLRVGKENTCYALFAQGLFYVDLVNSQRKLFKYDIIWDKILVSGFLNAKKMFMRRHEQLAIFYNKQPTYNPQMSKGEKSHSKGKAVGKKNSEVLGNENYGDFVVVENTSDMKYPTSIFTEEITIPNETVLSFQKPHPSVALHRTEKSIPFCEHIIKTFTNEGDVVLDNTMGSGVSGLASKNLKRKYIGVEKDKDIFETAVRRINE